MPDIKSSNEGVEKLLKNLNPFVRNVHVSTFCIKKMTFKNFGYMLTYMFVFVFVLTESKISVAFN